MKIVYFDLKHALEQHKRVLEISGGLHGYKDVSQLESVIAHIQNDSYYPNFLEKLGYLVFSVSTGHAFNDGNKRTAIALGSYFLEINELGGTVGAFIVHMEYLVVWLVERKISRDSFERATQSILDEGDLSESIQIELVKQLSVQTKLKI
jgi:death-on-curing protein